MPTTVGGTRAIGQPPPINRAITAAAASAGVDLTAQITGQTHAAVRVMVINATASDTIGFTDVTGTATGAFTLPAGNTDFGYLAVTDIVAAATSLSAGATVLVQWAG